MPPAVIQRKYGLDARGYQDSIRFADTGALPDEELQVEEMAKGAPTHP